MAKKPKQPPGTFVYRELFESRAFLSLSGFAPQLLILFLGKRSYQKIDDRKGKTKYIFNGDNLTMTYLELQKKYGINRHRAIRAVDQLLARGFLEIRHQGGAYKKDKTVYALSEKYLLWVPGAVLGVREHDVKRGYQSTNSTRVFDTHTHARKRHPKRCK